MFVLFFKFKTISIVEMLCVRFDKLAGHWSNSRFRNTDRNHLGSDNTFCGGKVSQRQICTCGNCIRNRCGSHIHCAAVLPIGKKTISSPT